MADAQQESEHAVRPDTVEDPAPGQQAPPDEIAEEETAEDVTSEDVTSEDATDPQAAEEVAAEEPAAPRPEPARAGTAEFRIPKVAEPEAHEETPDEASQKKAASLTRPDISVRKSPSPTVQDTPVQMRTREEPAFAPAPDPAPEPPAEPPQPAPPVQGPWEAAMPPQADPGLPGTRSSGQWTVPWEGQAPARPAQTPPTPAPAPAPAPERAAPVPPAPAAPEPAAPEPLAPVPPAPTPPVGAAAHEAAGRPRRGRRPLVIVLAAAVLVAGVVTGQLVRPAPDPTLEMTLSSAARHTFPGAAPALPWPAQGQSAVHVEGLGAMGASGGSAPTPTASVAKVMTAYVYLRGHPLRQGEPGPVLTVSPQAAAQIPARRKREESLLGVTANQRLTQRKALEALMIISANDVAHELARWDSGDEAAFVAKMNATARELGMTSTTYTDPSGYDSRTVSTAADQVKLLRAAMKVPAFAEVVNHPAYVPAEGGSPRPGGNILLGQYGVVGGKTGYTDAAGGNFVFAARKRVAGVTTLIVGAVMGQRSTSAMAAVTAGQHLVAAAEGALTAATLAPANARVARIDDGLGGGAPVRAASAVTVVGWPGLTVPVAVQGDPPRQGATGDQVGWITAGAAKVPLKLDRRLAKPSPLEKLIRIG